MAAMEFSLAQCAHLLGGYPERFFVDEHDSVYRVIEHSTGRVVGIVKTDGTFGHYRIEPNPGAIPVVATMAAVADQATMRP